MPQASAGAPPGPAAAAALSPVLLRRSRWAARHYTGTPDQAARVRGDIRADLDGYPEPLGAAVALCASELFANAVRHTRSGAPGGRVSYRLALVPGDRIRLAVADAGGAATAPRIPPRADAQWRTATDRRGLLLVAAVALAWGVHGAPAPAPATVWADFALHPPP
ncbi:ATP-binding protein [Nocardiopsis coralliicola]